LSARLHNFFLALGNEKLSLIDEVKNQGYEARSLLIPASEKSVIQTGTGPVLVVVLDYLGVDYQLLSLHMDKIASIEGKGAHYSNFSAEGSLIKAFHTLYPKCCGNPGAVFGYLEKVFSCLKQHTDLQRDRRVVMAADYIRTHQEHYLSIDDVAYQVNLSSSRLIQFFKQQTGVSIPRIRVWYRMLAVDNQLARGSSLSEAPFDYGFCDYAHFSNTYKRMSSISPKYLFSNEMVTLLSSKRV